jgi:hypothetical protein
MAKMGSPTWKEHLSTAKRCLKKRTTAKADCLRRVLTLRAGGHNLSALNNNPAR